MTIKEYILKEEKLIERAYRDKGLSPEAWISKNAQDYQRKYINKVIPACRPWFTYINKHERG